MHKILGLLILVASSAFLSCASGGSAKTAEQAPAPKPKVTVAFDADSAFEMVRQQVAFGPRVPNTQAHRLCGDWLLQKLYQYGASNVVEQNTALKAYDGTQLSARNISASFNPEATKRILLLSHWDSRPWADHDPDSNRRNQPIDGANDGASGVGVILEIARQMSLNSPRIGVDVLFVDAEDYGTRADQDSPSGNDNSWCLGSQYWAENPTIDPSTISYAVLLDMVGGKDAVFAKEYFSHYNCKDIVSKIWRTAAEAGYGDRFVDNVATPVIDDHLPLMRIGIPAVDIIDAAHPATGSFPPTWHTHADNIDNIDPATLKAVGQTLINLIYE